MDQARLMAMLIVFVIVWHIRMILYMLFYRIEAGHAFYAAMVPLITEALAMLFCVIRIGSSKMI